MRYFLLAFSLVFIDQFTKHYADSLLYLGQSVPVIPEYFHITLVQNPGAIFGILAHNRWFFVIVTIIGLIVLFFLMKDICREKIYTKLGLTLIISGAIGNLIDRLRFGYVIDFIDFRYWPVFNIADTALCIGAAFFLYELITSGDFLEKQEGR